MIIITVATFPDLTFHLSHLISTNGHRKVVVSPHVSIETSLLSACICRVGWLSGRLRIWSMRVVEWPLKRRHFDGGAILMMACRVSPNSDFRTKEDKGGQVYYCGGGSTLNYCILAENDLSFMCHFLEVYTWLLPARPNHEAYPPTPFKSLA